VSTVKIEYGYADGSANSVRPTSITYPDGRVLTYDYGPPGGMNDKLSRIQAIKDGSTTLVEYTYLGLNTIVQVDYPEPEVRYDLALDGTNTNPYAGLDRFGRVIDCRWQRTAGTPTDLERIQYGYDRASNRLWRQNVVATDQYSGENDELYAYDGAERLADLQRGNLNSGHDTISDLNFAQAWELDPTGNWNSFKQDDDGSSGWDLEQTREANEANEITDITGGSWVVPAYDRNGNMTTLPQSADPTEEYTARYDAWNRLVELSDSSGVVAQYAYDGRNFRTQQITDGGSTVRHYLYTHRWPGRTAGQQQRRRAAIRLGSALH